MIILNNYFEIDIYKIYINDIYNEDFKEYAFFIKPSRIYLDYDETNIIYAFLNGLGYRVDNPKEFIESMVAALFKYHQAMIVSGKLEKLTFRENENDELYG